MISRQIATQKSSMPHVHYHDLHELYYMARGSTTYYIGNKIYHIQRGNFVFIPKGILHKTAYETQSSIERLLINFSDAIFTNELQEIKQELYSSRVINIPEEKIPFFEALLKQIESEDRQKDAYSPIVLRLHITQLLVALCRYKCHFTPVFSGTDQTIYDISKYISRHFQESFSLKELSQTFSMSESHLSRTFKFHTGIGLTEYITYVRITHAEKLLKETSLSITQIAQQCGYSDSNYFSTVFKRVKQLSPQKYRKL